MSAKRGPSDEGAGRFPLSPKELIRRVCSARKERRYAADELIGQAREYLECCLQAEAFWRARTEGRDEDALWEARAVVEWLRRGIVGAHCEEWATKACLAVFAADGAPGIKRVATEGRLTGPGADNSFVRDTANLGALERRVFVSSTFRDMHAERDMMQRLVAPRLKAVCERHGERFELVDLRWGVSTSGLDEGAASERVVRACIDAVDKCHPYIVCFLGERYGWRPGAALWKRSLGVGGYTRLESCVKNVVSMDALSMTAGEILYGLGREGSEMVACVRVGSSEVSDEETGRSDCGAREPDDLFLMSELRGAVERACSDRLLTYEVPPSQEGDAAEWACVPQGGLLHEEIEKTLLGLFERDWSQGRKLGPYDKLRLANDRFARSEAQGFVGREKLLESLEREVVTRSDPLCLVAPVGAGKTALLAKMYQLVSSRGDAAAVPLFLDAAAAQIDLDTAMEYLETSLRLAWGLPLDIGSGAVFDAASCRKRLENALESMLHTGEDSCDVDAKGVLDTERVVLFIDAPEVVWGLAGSVVHAFGGLGWSRSGKRGALSYPRVSIVMACDLDAVGALAGRPYRLDVPTIDRGDFFSIVAAGVQRGGRDMSTALHRALAGLEAKANPLYAHLVARRLELIDGAFLSRLETSSEIEQAVAREVARLPGTLSGLATLLVRLADEVLPGTCRFVSLLAFAPWGLTKRELKTMPWPEESAWNDLSFEVVMGLLSPLVRETGDGRICCSLGRSDFDLEDLKSSKLPKEMIPLLICNTDGSVASLANILHLLRFADWKEEALTLLRLGVGKGEKPGVFSPSSLLDALLASFHDDDFAWYARALDEGAEHGSLMPSDVSFAFYVCRALPKVEVRQWAIRAVGTAALRACERMEGSGADLSYMGKSRATVEKLVRRAHMSTDPERWKRAVDRVIGPERSRAVLRREGVMVSYIGESYTWARLRVGAAVAYDLDAASSWNFNNDDVELFGYADAGIECILQNGYPFKAIYGNDGVDQFVTQAALWWYLAELGGAGLQGDFVANSADPYRLRPLIVRLVERGKRAREQAIERTGRPWGRGLAKVYASNQQDSALIVAFEPHTEPRRDKSGDTCRILKVEGTTRSLRP